MVKKKLNFRIVEVSESDRNYEHLYDDFKKDYLNPKTTASGLRDKYGIPPYQYREWSKKIRDEEGIYRKPNCKFGSSRHITPNQHIYKLSMSYGIRKEIDGMMEYFGKYEDLETARLVRDKLVDAKWDFNLRDKLIREYGYIKPTGVHPEILMTKYDEFKHLYLDVPTRYEDILERLELNSRSYTWLLNKLREEYGRDIKKCKLRCYDPNKSFEKPKKPTIPKIKSRPNRYIHKNSRGKYEIIKIIDGKQKYFGCYNLLGSARNRRNRLEANGWQT